jgi:hypothetical protein
MSFIEINDCRILKDFKGITFSKFKKSEAKKELIATLFSGNVEQSCYWSSEFICSGDFLYLWEIIFFFISKHIHIGNPKLPIYINSRLNIFINILNGGYSDNILKLRNNDEIRVLFIEIISILCFSKKKNTFTIPKIKENAFDMLQITGKLSAKHKKAGYKIFKNEDPREIFIAINELAWNISYKVKDIHKAIYWLEWIIEYDKICRKKKMQKKCSKRNMPVDDKFKYDMIWIPWDIIIHETKSRNNNLLQIINALLDIFCLKYKDSYKIKRKLIIYYAMSLLTEVYDTKVHIVKDVEIIKKIKENSNEIYNQIKKNEILPKTNYLFSNLGKNKNLENTISKLDKMNSLTYIPRN